MPMPETSCDDGLGLRLLNEFQQGFPVCPAPFAVLAGRLGVGEGAVLASLERLRREGRIARVGAVFAPKRIGASTLAAMAVPPDAVEAVAHAVNRFPEVNHNYEREHRYNLWFVVTAGSPGRLQATLSAIAKAAEYPVTALSMVKEFQPGVGPDGGGRAVPDEAGMTTLDEIGRRLLMILQEGLPLFIRPYSILASRLGCDEAELLERIRCWIADGVIKRFGIVVRRQTPDAGDNALWVKDVPDKLVGRLGGALANEASVALCYERARALPDWPYNLYCILRGPSRDGLLATIAELGERLGLTAYAGEVLFSAHRFKRDGVQYA